MKLLLFISGCALTFFLSACDVCSKKVSCPGFEDTLLINWFPYKENDRIKFTAGTNQSRQFTLAYFHSTGPYTASTRNSSCEATREISTNERDSIGNPLLHLQLASSGEYYNGGTGHAMNIVLLGLSIFGVFEENGFVNANSIQGSQAVLQYYNSVQLNGKTFSKVQSLYFDTTQAKKPPVYKVYISRGQGIIGYETYGPSLLWVKE